MSANELENHWLAISMTALIGLISWNLYSTNELQQKQSKMYAEIRGSLNLQSAQLDYLKQSFITRTLNRYTSVDASRDKSELMNSINILDYKMREINKDILKHSKEHAAVP